MLLKCVIRFSISFRWYAFPNFRTQISCPLSYGVRISSKASATAGISLKFNPGVGRFVKEQSTSQKLSSCMFHFFKEEFSSFKFLTVLSDRTETVISEWRLENTWYGPKGAEDGSKESEQHYIVLRICQGEYEPFADSAERNRPLWQDTEMWSWIRVWKLENKSYILSSIVFSVGVIVCLFSLLFC